MGFSAGEWVVIIGAVFMGIGTIISAFFAGLGAMRAGRSEQAAVLGTKQGIVLGDQNTAIAKAMTEDTPKLPDVETAAPKLDTPSTQAK